MRRPIHFFLAGLLVSLVYVGLVHIDEIKSLFPGGAARSAPYAAMKKIPVSDCDWRSGQGCPATPALNTCREAVYPDPHCNPGARNPEVTQANIQETICKSGWTSTVRPPTSYTTPIKRTMLAAYRLAGAPLANYELDHVVSLELGGAPSDPRNLWPESHEPAEQGSFAKDRVENMLKDEVCASQISLAEAQRRILHWARYR